MCNIFKDIFEILEWNHQSCLYMYDMYDMSEVGRRSIDLSTRQATGHQMSQQGQYLAVNDQKCLLRGKMVCIGSFYRGTNNTPFFVDPPQKEFTGRFPGLIPDFGHFGGVARQKGNYS